MELKPEHQNQKKDFLTVKEYRDWFCEKIPVSLSADWDNDGLLCCPDPEKPVRRILIALDITERVTDEAVFYGYDLLLSHHPLIFRGVKALTTEDNVSRKLLKLAQNGIAAMSFHTRLDAVMGGVNDLLAEDFGLRDVEPFGVDAVPIGRIGTLPHPLLPEAFARMVKEVLHAPAVVLSSAGKEVSRVAVLGGSGKEGLDAAMAAGADTYLSGELSYHQLTDAPERGMNLLTAGHFYTEFPVCRRLETLAKEADPKVETTILFSDAAQYF